MNDETKKSDTGATAGHTPGTAAGEPHATATAASAATAATGGAQSAAQASAASSGANDNLSAAAEAGSATAAPDAALLAAEVVKLEGQIKDLTDRLLRAHADIDNLRKRGEREREETARYAISKFAIDIVGMTDNFQRAITAVPADAAEADPALQTLIDGVTMTEAEFMRVLERHGVKRIDPKGDIFNPHFHQAMMEQQNPEVPAGTILQVFQPGYQIADRVIRPAMVVVARGGAKVAAKGNGDGAA